MCVCVCVCVCVCGMECDGERERERETTVANWKVDDINHKPRKFSGILYTCVFLHFSCILGGSCIVWEPLPCLVSLSVAAVLICTVGHFCFVVKVKDVAKCLPHYSFYPLNLSLLSLSLSLSLSYSFFHNYNKYNM